MLSVDPIERASIPQIFNHAWVRSYGNTPMLDSLKLSDKIESPSTSPFRSSTHSTVQNSINSYGPSSIGTVPASTSEKENMNDSLPDPSSQIEIDFPPMSKVINLHQTQTVILSFYRQSFFSVRLFSFI